MFGLPVAQLMAYKKQSAQNLQIFSFFQHDEFCHSKICSVCNAIAFISLVEIMCFSFLTHLWPMISFHTPEKHQKTFNQTFIPF